MTRDEIRATIEGLEDQSRDGRGDLAGLAIDALTLLREIAAVNLPTISCMMEIIDEMDRERKAVSDGR